MQIDKSITIFIRDMRNRAKTWGSRSNQYSLSEIEKEMSSMADDLEQMVKTGKSYDKVLKQNKY